MSLATSIFVIKCVWHVIRKVRTSSSRKMKNYFSHLVMRTSGTCWNSRKKSKFHKNAFFPSNLECSVLNQRFLQSHSMGLKTSLNASVIYLKSTKSPKYFSIGSIFRPIFWLLFHEFSKIEMRMSKGLPGWIFRLFGVFRPAAAFVSVVW